MKPKPPKKAQPPTSKDGYAWNSIGRPDTCACEWQPDNGPGGGYLLTRLSSKCTLLLHVSLFAQAVRGAKLQP